MKSRDDCRSAAKISQELISVVAVALADAVGDDRLQVCVDPDEDVQCRVRHPGVAPLKRAAFILPTFRPFAALRNKCFRMSSCLSGAETKGPHCTKGKPCGNSCMRMRPAASQSMVYFP
jgi:hypothetical protein